MRSTRPDSPAFPSPHPQTIIPGPQPCTYDSRYLRDTFSASVSDQLLRLHRVSCTLWIRCFAGTVHIRFAFWLLHCVFFVFRMSSRVHGALSVLRMSSGVCVVLVSTSDETSHFCCTSFVSFRSIRDGVVFLASSGFPCLCRGFPASDEYLCLHVRSSPHLH